MGWGYGVNSQGREVGYSIEAICGQKGCEKSIDRGLAYVCGGMHDGGERGCGGYFCYEHLEYVDLRSGQEEWDLSEQLCPACAKELEASVHAESDAQVRKSFRSTP